MKNDVNAAVKNLREALGDTQQQFATRMGMAISTVVRYELTRPPKGKVLRQFEELAMQHGQEPLATVFRKALADEAGVDLPVYWRAPAPINEAEEWDVVALLWMRRHPDMYTKELASWERISKAVKKERKAVEQRALAIAKELRALSATDRQEKK